MKKKSLRKIASTKKVISKSPLKKKKSFSLKSWLIGTLVLLSALAYGLYQYNLQPKAIEVLEVSGTALDYLEPEAVSINLIKSCEKDPECADLVSAAQQVGAQTTLQQGTKTNIQAAKEIKTSLNSTPVKESVTKNPSREPALKEANTAANNIIEKVTSEVNKVLNADRIADQSVVGSGASCQTSAGFTVAAGETMVGLVQTDQKSPDYGKNMIVQCKNGKWETLAGCYEKNGTITGGSTCSLTVKPVYAQKPGERNCYNDNGATVLGNGSIVERGDGKADRCDDGSLTKDLTKVDGVWMTAEDLKKYEAEKAARDANRSKELAAAREANCKADNGVWKNGACIVDSRAKTCVATPGNTWDSTKEVCVSNKSNLVNPNGTKTGGETTTKATDCIYGGTVITGGSSGAIFRCNDSTGKVPQTTEKCQAQGTVVVCKVYDLTGKYLSEYRKTAETISNQVNANGIYQNGEETTKESDCIYGGELISGSSYGAKFRCYNSDKKLPLAATNFGNTTSNSDTNNSLGRKPGEPCSRFFGGSDDLCSSGICERRDESANGGKEGYFCTDTNGSIPSARVDDSRYSYDECKRNLPDGQECHHYDGTDEWYRSIKPVILTQVSTSGDRDIDTSKKIGDTCNNGYLFNTCDQCPSTSVSYVVDLSKNRTGTYYCGSSQEIDKIVNAGYKLPEKKVSQFDKPENVDAIWVKFPSGNQPVYIDNDSKKYYNSSYCNDNSQCLSNYCDNPGYKEPQCVDKSITDNSNSGAPFIVSESNLPTPGVKIASGSVAGAAAGAAIAGTVCGVGAFVLGNLFTGLGGFVAAPVAAANCAAWGAGIGAIGGGTAAYIDSPSQPSEQTSTTESMYSRPDNIEPKYVEGPSANSTEFVYEGPDGLYNDSYCETNDECASGYCKPYNFVNNPRSHCDDPE